MKPATQTKPSKLIPKNEDIFDLIIIGAGPAGMSAALCATRANLKTLIIEKALPGGETTNACIIDNYLGFPGGITGEKLAKQMETHLFSHSLHYSCESVEKILNHKDKIKIVQTELGHKYKTKNIVLAVGLVPKKFQNKATRTFLGRGISYCAKGDGKSYTEKEIVVLGGGNCACYAAEYLSTFVKRVYLVHRFDDLKAVTSLKNRILNNTRITVMWSSEITEIFGIDKIEKIKIVNTINQQYTWLDSNAIFVYLGRTPPQDIKKWEVRLDENEYIITDEYMRTNISGIYAVGDIRSKQIKQIATAVSDGMIAAINVDKNIRYSL
jgi:thioredoxin reductase (NADPH)